MPEKTKKNSWGPWNPSDACIRFVWCVWPGIGWKSSARLLQVTETLSDCWDRWRPSTSRSACMRRDRYLHERVSLSCTNDDQAYSRSGSFGCGLRWERVVGGLAQRALISSVGSKSFRQWPETLKITGSKFQMYVVNLLLVTPVSGIEGGDVTFRIYGSIVRHSRHHKLLGGLASESCSHVLITIDSLLIACVTVIIGNVMDKTHAIFVLWEILEQGVMGYVVIS